MKLYQFKLIVLTLFIQSNILLSEGTSGIESSSIFPFNIEEISKNHINSNITNSSFDIELSNNRDNRDIQILVLSGGLSHHNDEIINFLSEYFEDSEFTSFFMNGVIPDIEFLQQFNTILLYENACLYNGYVDSIEVGNIIYEYVMSGGNLIQCTFVWQDNDFEHCGGWGNLSLIDPLYGGSCTYSTLFLDVDSLIDHPLTQNLEDIYTNYGGGVSNLRDDATAVAFWDTGHPLIAYNEPNGKIVSLTLYPAPVYSGGSSFQILWHNVINFIITDIVCPELSGDINDDSSVDVLDILIIVDLLLNGGFDSYDECADINSDGNLDVMDTINLVSIILDNS